MIVNAERKGLSVYRIGQNIEQNYHINELGTNPDILHKILSGKDEFHLKLKKAKKPIFIIGTEIIMLSDIIVLSCYCNHKL